MKLSPDTFMHPKDKAALKQLEAIPGFPALVKKIMSMGFETYQYGLNMASSIRLSENQLPEIYKHLPPICEKLCIPVPELYLSMSPVPNAWTSGDERIYITLTSALLECVTDEELDAIIAHECGHILCHHVLYHMVANYLKLGADIIGVLGNLSIPVQWGLFYWSRMSELSSDRVAALVTNPELVSAVMARLAGGPKNITQNINFDEWAKQAYEYESISNDGTWNKFLKIYSVLDSTHPFAAVRVKEIREWCAGEEYKRVKGILDNIPTCMAKCDSCGNNVEDSWMFCRYCGHKLK